MDTSEAQRLLELLLADSSFSARFRADPAGAARAAGFHGLAAELETGDATPLQALEARESRSSLAGAFAAAVAEGFALVDVGGRLFGVEDASAAIGPAPSGGQPWNPDWYGMAGSGGPVIPEADALLHNEHISFDVSGIADLKAGRIDPRVVAVLTEISHDHDIGVSCTSSDHPMHTAGGSISNHYYGRAIDIATVDGEPVTAANGAARALALALSQLDPSIRPSEIGSPWPLSGAAYFSDSDHQDHLHVGFDDPIRADWKPSEDAGAAAAQVPAPTPPPPVSPDPDDWEGNLDDEDGGADELDGSNEDEADEAGGEDDDSVAPSADQGSPDAPAAGGGDEEGSDDEEGGDDEDEEDEEDENEGADEPGEGSNGEDAVDDNAGSDSSGDSGSGSGNDSGADDAEDDSENPDEDDRQDPDLVGGSNDGSNDGSPEAPDPDPGAALDAPDDYPGDDATRQEVAAWMAAEAEKRGLPPELPVMASLVESGLRNLSYGDADSVGFFQMRTSVWDQGDYEGYADQPALQLKWFLDRAGALKQHRLSAGAPVDDPESFGEWIADVERPAEQYRGRYQLRLDEARSLLDEDAGSQAASPSPGDEAQILRAVDPDDGT